VAALYVKGERIFVTPEGKAAKHLWKEGATPRELSAIQYHIKNEGEDGNLGIGE
jgi:hypothetical protein